MSKNSWIKYFPSSGREIAIVAVIAALWIAIDSIEVAVGGITRGILFNIAGWLAMTLSAVSLRKFFATVIVSLIAGVILSLLSPYGVFMLIGALLGGFTFSILTHLFKYRLKTWNFLVASAVSGPLTGAVVMIPMLEYLPKILFIMGLITALIFCPIGSLIGYLIAKRLIKAGIISSS